MHRFAPLVARPHGVSLRSMAMNRYPKHSRILTLVVVASLGTFAIESAQAADAAAFWKDSTMAKASTAGAPTAYRAVTLDQAGLKTELSAAASSIRQGRSNNLPLPLQEGGV